MQRLRALWGYRVAWYSGEAAQALSRPTAPLAWDPGQCTARQCPGGPGLWTTPVRYTALHIPRKRPGGPCYIPGTPLLYSCNTG